MEEHYTCQSCAMPLTKEVDWGTEADGAISEDYCNFCYKKGQFTDEGLTVEQKIDKVVDIAVNKLGMDETKAREEAEKKLPTLKRWKS